MSTDRIIATHSAVDLLVSGAPRSSNHSLTFFARAATELNRGSSRRSSRPVTRKKALTWGSVFTVNDIHPLAV